MSPFFRRLLLWFWAANVATLLISVLATHHLAFLAYGGEPDWAALAEQANATYIHGGAPALADWAEVQRRRGILAALFEGRRNLLPPRSDFGPPDTSPPSEPPPEASPSGPAPPLREPGGPPPLPHPLMDHLWQLLDGDNIVLRPRPNLYLAGQSVTGSDGVRRRLVAMRAPRPGERLDLLLGVQIALSLLIIGIVGGWLARGIAQPVAALSTAARRMATGDLTARVEQHWTQGKDEIGRLAGDFNAMAERIEALVTHERRVLQDISHELRSPLARLHLNMELARRGNAEQLDRAEREVMRLDRLLSEVLALARLEGGLPGMTREACDLGAIAAQRIEEARLLPGAPELRLEAQTGVVVDGSVVLLERALDNLLSNAIKYGGNGVVDITVRSDGDDACVTVRDCGAGVAAEDTGALLRPFFRGSNASGSEGQGLGLAVVARIAQAHGGTISAGNAESGGFVATLRLPLAKPPAAAGSVPRQPAAR
jgi:signal transduction histidine kinase